MVRLTAALIARDEEAHIEECLDNLKPVVDEIIVVDTGSIDSTPEIAVACGARVFAEPWRNDFAYARNAALAHASGTWILYVDADERIEVIGDLDGVLSDPDAIAARVNFRASRRLTPYLEHRLFRNRPDIRFKGVIHETIMPNIRALVEQGEGKVVDAAMTFEHLGYDGDLSRKHRRNLPLLRRAVVDDPQRVYLWHTLGEAAAGVGDLAGAEAAWRRGLAVVRGRKPHPGDALIYADLLDLYLSEAADQPSDAKNLMAEAGRRHPDDPLVLWWTARHLVSRGSYAEARACLTRVLAYGPDGPPQGQVGYDRQLFGALPWGLLGICWFQEGEPKRALEWLRRAEEADSSNLEIRVKRAYAEGIVRTRNGGI